MCDGVYFSVCKAGGYHLALGHLSGIAKKSTIGTKCHRIAAAKKKLGIVATKTFGQEVKTVKFTLATFTIGRDETLKEKVEAVGLSFVNGTEGKR